MIDEFRNFWVALNIELRRLGEEEAGLETVQNAYAKFGPGRAIDAARALVDEAVNAVAKASVKQFRVTYFNGFEVIEVKDIYAAAAYAKKRAKRTFQTPIKIEELFRPPAIIDDF